MRDPAIRIHLDGLVIDSFAGGGGASLGIEMAMGRSPDIAINHDPEAIAMHQANHPDTHHVLGDIWDANPRKLCAGREVALAWFSPDCTFHSKARGGKPFRDPKAASGRRGLAWVVVRWARDVRPRVIMLENVEEFADWGPLGEDGRPDPARRGLTFRRWWGMLAAQGYAIEMRELRACDYGTPTTRKRLFVIARCDGMPIVWPTATHGAGTGQAYRSAAECIDWSLPCPSIFERKKPLAEKTLRRIARGIQRFVIDSAAPFIVPTAHAGDDRCHSIDEPLRTVTGAHRGDHALVAPMIAPATHGDSGGREDTRIHDAREPLRTIITRGAPFHVVAPVLARTDMHQSNAACVFPAEEPLRTVTTGGSHAVVAAALTSYHGGESFTRVPPLDEPMRTLDTANRFALAAATLIHSGNGERQGQAPRVYDLEKPLTTVMAEGQKHAVVSAFLARHFGGEQPGSPRGGRQASPIPEPVPTLTARNQTSLVAAHLLKLHGSCADGQRIEQPAPTVRAQGTHLAEVRAFLTQYNGTSIGQGAQLPLGTVTTHDRFGLVTVDGVAYEIADIGLRMLAPRELFRAQGFPDQYVIDLEVDGKRLTKEAQIRMCGNSVCPPIAAALVMANCAGERVVAA